MTLRKFCPEEEQPDSDNPKAKRDHTVANLQLAISRVTAGQRLQLAIYH